MPARSNYSDPPSHHIKNGEFVTHHIIFSTPAFVRIRSGNTSRHRSNRCVIKFQRWVGPARKGRRGDFYAINFSPGPPRRTLLRAQSASDPFTFCNVFFTACCLGAWLAMISCFAFMSSSSTGKNAAFHAQRRERLAQVLGFKESQTCKVCCLGVSIMPDTIPHSGAQIHPPKGNLRPTHALLQILFSDPGTEGRLIHPVRFPFRPQSRPSRPRHRAPAP